MAGINATEHRFSRRAALVYPLTGLPLAALATAGEEFWKTKAPEEWSVEDCSALLTASPWAVSTKVTMAGGQNPPPIDAPTAHIRGMPPAPKSVVPDLVEIPKSSTHNSAAPMAFYGEVKVTWESAAPVRIARKEPLDAEFVEHYAIRITGLPAQTFMPDVGEPPIIYRLLMGATLEVEGRKRQPSDYVLRLPEKKSLVFAFPKNKVPLNSASRFVWFNLSLNQMMVRVRFDLRLMSFQNQTAI